MDREELLQAVQATLRRWSNTDLQKQAQMFAYSLSYVVISGRNLRAALVFKSNTPRKHSMNISMES